ncbi:unnamed protein product [Mytilus coruscus]|uniref:Uncharacterized protein n=1 Tax=Mytilus coruscus TaxID=42192 RepID=A0A6J8D429_MYTCO|nr:unnamed protein product [Mytilus coruscus]
MSKIGGGPPPTQLSIAEENIVNAMKDSASFSGVVGIETDITSNEANHVTNGSQSPCIATPRPTAEEFVWIRALDRHHSNLQNNQQTCAVADDAEGTDRNATCPGPGSSASSQSQTKRSSSSCRLCYYTFTTRHSSFHDISHSLNMFNSYKPPFVFGVKFREKDFDFINLICI